MKHLYFYCLAFAAMAFVPSCKEENITYKELEWPETENKNGDVFRTDYNGQYRPQIHYTPAKNWINDPNGLIYVDGTYHMFYQYNPYGNAWGNISWGHATSKNLITWEEQAVALYKDASGDIFSGSAVCDVNNTAGFGEGSLVAIYTLNGGGQQQQCLAYSRDGYNLTKYSGNPVLSNGTDKFRDPKVFWYDGTDGGYWVMAVTLGIDKKIEFYKSVNLKDWTKLSEFDFDCGKRDAWECPDLIKMNYNGQDKWVLIISVGPGGVVEPGTMYFIGDFNGTTFTADTDDYNYPLWLDYGLDNYAGITWNDAPDNRKILIGWMNNWNYSGALPTSPWKSAMTLPRELSLIEYNGKPLLSSKVVSEIESIAGEWKNVDAEELGVEGPYQLQLTFNISSGGKFFLENDKEESMEFSVNNGEHKLITQRTANSGVVNFSDKFDVESIAAPFNTVGDEVTLDIFVDNSSVELFTENGSMAQTTLVFPQSIYNRLRTENMNIVSAKVRALNSIW